MSDEQNQNPSVGQTEAQQKIEVLTDIMALCEVIISTCTSWRIIMIEQKNPHLVQNLQWFQSCVASMTNHIADASDHVQFLQLQSKMDVIVVRDESAQVDPVGVTEHHDEDM